MRAAGWRRCVARGAAALVSFALLPVAAQEPVADGHPLAVLEPWITWSADERARLDVDQSVGRPLAGGDGQISVVVATRLKAAPESLAAWTHEIAAFKRSQFVHAIGRFSNPPELADLDAMALDDRDLDEVRRCRPGSCGLKLRAAEIVTLTSAAAAGGANWHEAVQRAFRQVVLDRVQAYRAGGLSALGAPADRGSARPIEVSFAAILERSPYLDRFPELGDWLRRYPSDGTKVDSFFYWSKEFYGGGKAVIGVTHVGIVRPTLNGNGPATIVAGKQIFSTHYSQTSLGLSMALPGVAGSPSYLVYVNRSSLDVLGGLMGPLARSIMERRLSRQAPIIVSGLRARLESGPPPAARTRGLAPLARGLRR